MPIFKSLFLNKTFALALLTFAAFGQELTVEVGAPQQSPLPLVNHSDSWHFHKGTNAPMASWKTIDDASLGAQWGTGAGGFGYADNAAETALCGSILSDMEDLYRTLYIRKTFAITTAPDPGAHLLLTIDYDDAFVAYLDGVELTRSANAPGAAGAEPASSATATSSHESSRGNNTPANPATTIDLGAVGNRLGSGSHVFAVIGLNQDISSSDFVLLADLTVTQPGSGTVSGGPIMTIVGGASTRLSGSNTVAGATRVHVNGDAAAFDVAAQTWAKTNLLSPGVNKLFIAALDDAGNLLASTNRIIVSEPIFTPIEGMLGPATEWSSDMGVIHVTNTVVIPENGTLTIQPGTTLLMTPGTGVTGTNAVLRALGTMTRPICFLPADGTSGNWGGLTIFGAGGVMTLEHVETIAGYVELQDGAIGNLSDSYFHDYWIAIPPILSTFGSPNPVTLTLERCHIANYHEILSRMTTNYFSDCLLENLDLSGDGIDFDNGLEGSYVRRCTVRRGLQPNTDALDMGEYGANGTRVLIDSCLLRDFVDKGVSMGVAASVGVTNTLIYNVDSGFGVKDSSVAGIFNCTVANANYGIRAYNKADTNSATGGGHVTNSFNNIFWGLTNAAVSLANGSTLAATFSDFQDVAWPGVGNISVDPLFVDPAVNDFRVKAGSPTLGAGLDGANLGVAFPVGGIPAAPLRFAAIVNGYEAPTLAWQDDADNETEFQIERSTNAVDWSLLGNAAVNTTTFSDASATPGQKYYYRVFATNSSGRSDYSNPASAMRRKLTSIASGSVGGIIADDTIWEADGTFTVTNAITVQNGAILTIERGARVLFNSALNMTVADGGRLMAEGTAQQPILFSRAGASGSWGQLIIRGSPGSPESKISHTRFEFNAPSSGQPTIEVAGGTVALDHLTFGETTSPYLHLDGASFVVSHCHFPTGTRASGFELVHGTEGIKTGGRGIIRHNYFGATTNYNDVVDFTGGNRPGPIIQFYNNVFIGSGDDIIDLDGTDAWIEGNIFLHVHKNGSPDTASAISGGSDSGDTSELTVIGNLFFDCDQAVTAKQGNFYALLNNTIVHITNTGGTDVEAAAVNVGEEGVAPSNGLYLEGNIIVDAQELVRTYSPPATLVTFNKNILPLAWNGPGVNNAVVDPLLKHVPTVGEATFVNWMEAQVVWDWFSLQPGSPAIGSGLNGADKGASLSGGVSISGEPAARTTSREATLIIGDNRSGSGISTAGWPLGAGFTHYKWRLDANSWSQEIPILDPIVVTNLTVGSHHIEVIGKNDAGFFQNNPELGDAANITVSRTWNVEPGLSFDAVQHNGSTVQLQFMVEAGTTYTIQFKNDLNDTGWLKLVDVAAQPANGIHSAADMNLASQNRFYRVISPSQP